MGKLPVAAVGRKKSNVEPDRRVERTALMQTQPGEFAKEPLPVVGRRKVPVGQSPIGDGPGHAVDQLPYARLPRWRAGLAVKVLAGDDVRGELTPSCRDLAAGLLEDRLPRLVLDARGSHFPGNGFKWVGDAGRAKRFVDCEPTFRSAESLRFCTRSQ
jgi:hypothetical protein